MNTGSIVPHSPSDHQSHQFNFEGVDIRAFIDADGTPLFLGADVCLALNITNQNNAYARLEDDEKGIRTMDTLGGRQQVTVLTEAGLYSVIFESRKENAKRFKRWVIHEVLPAIRKTGHYSVQMLTPAETILEQAKQLVAHERQIADHENRLTQLESHAQPENDYYTVLAYARRVRKSLDYRSAQMIGHRAAKLSRDRGLTIGRTSDPRFGEVNTYHESILAELFG